MGSAKEMTKKNNLKWLADNHDVLTGTRTKRVLQGVEEALVAGAGAVGQGFSALFPAVGGSVR